MPILTCRFRNLSYAHTLILCLLLTLHSQMETATSRVVAGGKTTTKQSRNVSRNLQELWSGKSSSRRETRAINVETRARKRTWSWEVLWETRSRVKKTSRDPPFLCLKQEGVEGKQTAATLKGDREQTQNTVSAIPLRHLDSACFRYLETLSQKASACLWVLAISCQE